MIFLSKVRISQLSQHYTAAMRVASHLYAALIIQLDVLIASEIILHFIDIYS